MPTFKPKLVLDSARKLEAAGQKKEAALQFSLLAQFLIKNHRYTEAMKLVEKSLKLYTNFPRAYLQRAVCAVELKDLPVALKSISELAKKVIAAKKIDKYIDFVRSEFKNQFEVKVKFFETVISIDRTMAKPFIELASVLIDMKEFKKAQEKLLNALKIEGTKEKVIELLKETIEENKIEKGLEHLKALQSGKISIDDFITLLKPQAPSFEMASKSFVTLEKKINTLIFDLMEEVGLNPKEDIDQVKPLLNEFKNKSKKVLEGEDPTRVDLAIAFFEMGFLEAAEEQLLLVKKESPSFLKAQLLLSEIYSDQNSDMSALETIQKVLRLAEPDSSYEKDARYKLIVIFMRLEDYEKAYEQAKILTKTSPNYRQLKTKLAEIEKRVQKLAS
jgi:tetratricopeptide (TPR) repeat protein